MKKINRRSLPAPLNNIYDQFLIVGLHPGTLVPTVLSSYPSQKAASPNVALFCFPEDITPENVNKLRMGASFFFVLTDEVGRQQVGFTRRTGKGKDMLSLCMLTHRDSSWMYTFGSLLEECEGRYRANTGQLEPFLAALFVAPLPDPGEDILVCAPNGASTPITLQYARSVPCPDTTDTALFGVTMLPLLANLTTIPILQLFASLLFERRTILVSQSLERVSACVQAAVSALFPFAWHHIFIPVLPLSLVDYCSAPMPFVIGLHSSLLLSLQKMPMSEVVLVDLDRDQVNAVPGDLALLPQSLMGPLRTVLDAATADFHRITSTSKSTLDWQRVAEAFRHFFVRVFHSYGKFFVQKPGATEARFDKDAFIQAQPKQIRKFLEVFCASQMFERFIAEREIGKQNVLFENEIKLYEVSQAHAGIGMQIQDKAKQGVAKLSSIGTTLRTHLENPFLYRRESDTSTLQPQGLARSASANSQPSLHPSLVRGQVSSDPPRRTTKPLPPLPPNAGTGAAATSAFPPNILAGGPVPLNPWDAFTDNTDPLQPGNTYGGRPKSATVTSTTPATNPTNTTPPPLVHNSSSANLLLNTPLPVNTNVFELHPFGNITPATPAPSISNTASSHSAWYKPETAGVEIHTPAPNPFLLPPVSMKPHNPFLDEDQVNSNPQPTPAGSHNIFTSFDLDTLAPPDNAHTLSSSYGGAPTNLSKGIPIPSFSSSTGDYFNTGTVAGFGSPGRAGGFGSPSSSGAFGSPSASGAFGPPNTGGYGSPTSSGGISKGTVPNIPIPSPNGGTVPNYANYPPQSPQRQGADNFDNFLAARVPPLSPSGPPAIVVHSPQHPSKPTPVSPSNPGRPSEDEFDSFLSARMSQM